MKKIIIVILLLMSAMLLSKDKAESVRPSNVPADAKYNDYWYEYESDLYGMDTENSISWRKDGFIRTMMYLTADGSYLISERYNDNGIINYFSCRIWNRKILGEKIYKADEEPDNVGLIGRIPLYYPSGQMKEDRYYTIILNKRGRAESVLCGTQIFYDENGKELKRVEHRKCELGLEEPKRMTESELVEVIRKKRELAKRKYTLDLPKVGQVEKRDGKEINVKYYEESDLDIGDQVCAIVDDGVVLFECRKNGNGIGNYSLITDEKNLYKSVKEGETVYFWLKNKIKNEDLIKKRLKPKAGDEIVVGNIEFVYIPGGIGNDWTVTNKKTQIKGFWMSKYEMTWGEYAKHYYEAVRKYNKGLFRLNIVKVRDKLTVDLGKYDTEAVVYCRWFGERFGVKARLATTNEWEYAARGGTNSKYYWGNGDINEYCWYKGNSGGKLHEVGQKKPNGYGLYDMIGNAWEWTSESILKGGSKDSPISELGFEVKHIINYPYYDSRGITSYLEIVNQGTSFRVVIEAE